MAKKSYSKGAAPGSPGMEVHYCIQEGNVATLTQSVDRIASKVFGNGRPGLDETVPMLATKIDNLSTRIDGLSTNVSALMKYSDQDFGATTAIEKRKLSNAQWTAIVFSAVLGIAAIIVTIILKT